MVKLEWGAKRTCLGCGVHFYDLQKLPAPCPKCGTVFELQVTTRGRRGKGSLDSSKEVLGLEDVIIDDLEISDNLSGSLEDDLIEDDADLGEGLDDIHDMRGDKRKES